MLVLFCTEARAHPQTGAVPTGSKPAEAPQDPIVKDVRSLTQADLGAIRDRMVPLVERYAGRKFKSKPKIQVTHNSTLGQILNAEFEAQFGHMFPTLAKKELERFTSTMAGVTSLGLLGKFDTDSKVLYILPGMFDIMVKAKKISKRHELELLTLIVAHELTHALQDTWFPLSVAIAGIDDQSGMHAYSGCIEGHATYIQDLIAKELGIEAAAREYHTLLVGKKTKARMDFALRYQRSLSSFYYSRGARFFEALVKKRGKSAAWELLENPPIRSDYLYGSPLTRRKDADPKAASPQLLAELAPLFTKRPRQIMASTADQTLLRCLLVSGRQETVDAILRPLREAWFVQTGSFPRMGLALGMRFADEKSAKSFFDAAPRILNDELHLSTGYKALLRTDFQLDGLPLRDSKLGMDQTKLTYTFRKGKFGQVKGEIRWYQKGKHVIQIDISNMLTKSAQLDKMAQRALTLMTQR